MNNGRYGRLVNDSLTPNCKMEKLLFNNRPYLCIFAKRDIAVGEELHYDYGVESLWWRPVNTHAILHFNEKFYSFFIIHIADINSLSLCNELMIKIIYIYELFSFTGFFEK